MTDQTAHEFEPPLGPATDRRGRLDRDQVESLLRAIAPARVMADGKGHAHVSQQDVTAHLIRTFGFGGFDTRILSLDLVFEMPRDDKGQRWDVCYRATVELTIRNRGGETVATYQNVSTGDAQNQKRADGHDLAAKSAVSLATKRCAINLGDQFGLSLYNRGQMAALVRRTLVMPEAPDAPGDAEAAEQPRTDLQEGIPQQVAMGAHEDDTMSDDHPAEQPAQQAAGEIDADPLPENWEEVAQAAEGEGDLDLITNLLKSAVAVDSHGEAAQRLRAAWTRVNRGAKAAKGAR